MSYIPQGPDPIKDDTAAIGIEWRTAWQRADAQMEADALALWTRLQVLPPGLDPTERLKELCVLAYAEGRLAAISTAAIRELPPVRQRMAFFRCVVAPEYRNHSVGRVIGTEARKVLEAWSLANPHEGVMGMAAVVQTRDVNTSRAVYRSTGLTLIGYNERDEQVRVAWFDHARVY